MLDLILALLAFLASLILLASPVLALIAIVKVSKLERELRRLERSSGAPSRTSSEDQPRRVEASSPWPEPARALPTPPPQAAAPEATRPASVPVPDPAPLKPVVVASDRPQAKPAAPAPKRERIQWEQWVGIRGAAVLGGILFALAGILFFKHAFDRGWITPAMRIALGATVGLVSLAASELFRRRDYRFAPAATAGAGLVVLYATIWASFRLYEFTSALAALPLMALVTALSAFVAVRFQSQLVAILGLVGGFAAPLLLSIQADHPIGLFGYVLLLDLGLLGLGLRMRWPSLGLFGMIGTFLIELVWSARHFDASLFPLALASLAVFALVFAAAGQRSPGSSRRAWLTSQAGSVLLPFAFAAYFASMADLGSALWPLALLIAFLAVAAGWIAVRQQAKWLVSGAASGAVAVCATWLVGSHKVSFSAWDFALSTVYLSTLFYLSELYFGRSKETLGTRRWSVPLAPAIAVIGFGLLNWVAVTMRFSPSPWPWLVASLGPAVLLHLIGSGERAGVLRVVGASLAGLGMATWLHVLVWEEYLSTVRETPARALPSSADTLVWIVLACSFLCGLAWWSRRRESEVHAHWAARAASVFPLLLAFSQSFRHQTEAHPGLVMTTSLSLALFAALPGVLSGSGRWFGAALVLFLLDRSRWTSSFLSTPENASIAGDLFVLELSALLVLATVPLIARRTLGASRVAWAALALAMIVALGTANRLLEAHFAADRPALAAAALALLALGIFGLTRFSLARGSIARESADRWLLGSAAFLTSISLAEAAEHHSRLLVHAYAALFLAVLWRWRPSLGLKTLTVGFASLSAAGIVHLCFRGLESRAEHFESAPILVWNWTSYATGVPALCALLAALVIGTRETAHVTNLEQRRPLRGRAWASAWISLVATVLLFVWINLQVLTYFETGPMLRLAHDYGPACDLTLSVSWIGYALLLLAVGMARGVAGLRQVSLAFLLLTLFKVFLRDLGDLEGLYRVGSLLGLGVSLILVSLLYQRFVFPRRSGAGEAVEGSVA